jgi:hypothetical protein
VFFESPAPLAAGDARAFVSDLADVARHGGAGVVDALVASDWPAGCVGGDAAAPPASGKEGI